MRELQTQLEAKESQNQELMTIAGHVRQQERFGGRVSSTVLPLLPAFCLPCRVTCDLVYAWAEDIPRPLGRSQTEELKIEK